MVEVSWWFCVSCELAYNIFQQEPHIEFTDVDLLHATMIRPNSVVMNVDIKASMGPTTSTPAPKTSVQLSCSKEVHDEDFVTKSTLPVQIKVSGGD